MMPTRQEKLTQRDAVLPEYPVFFAEIKQRILLARVTAARTVNRELILLYWQHGHSTEQDFIYVTTASLTHAQLQQISDEVGPDCSLLVVCTSFRGSKDGNSNLTVKKIPKAVLSRCEWGHDDYSLQVENLPKAPPRMGQQSLFGGEVA